MEPFNQWQILMAKLYIFADRFEVPRLKSAALDIQASNLLCHSNIHPPHSETVKFVFENFPKGDVLL
jgi:hypothetical protein